MSRYKIERYIVGTRNKGKEIQKAINHFARKERYMEHDLKREIVVVDSENEKIFFYPSKEDSFERLCENVFYFEGGKSAEDEALNRIMIEELWIVIGKLSDIDKKILLLSALYGKSQKEIAENLGINQSSVSRRLEKTRNIIKILLDK